MPYSFPVDNKKSASEALSEQFAAPLLYPLYPSTAH
jgi:hypothetical protein